MNSTRHRLLLLVLPLAGLLIVGAYWYTKDTGSYSEDAALGRASSTADTATSSAVHIATSTSTSSEVATEINQPVTEAIVVDPPVEEKNDALETVENTLPAVEEPPEPLAVPVSGVSTAHQSSILIGHNTARTAKGLATLSWSRAVADSAQAWADVLGDQGCPLRHSDSLYGENLYYSWTTGELVLNPKDAVKWWLSEEAFYDYDSNTCEPGEQCGHYTQIVWDDTREVGCGVTTCTEPGKNTQMWVCQYSPAGNINGDRPY